MASSRDVLLVIRAHEQCSSHAENVISAGASAHEDAVPRLTETSQPGELAVFHGRPWWQRAYVSVFVARPELVRALAAHAAEAGLAVRACRPGRRAEGNGERDAVDVTTWEGHGVMTGMGDRISPRAVRRTFPGCDRQAVREVTRAWQVTLIDPEWGRNTLLWSLLTQFLNSRTLHPT